MYFPIHAQKNILHFFPFILSILETIHMASELLDVNVRLTRLSQMGFFVDFWTDDAFDNATVREGFVPMKNLPQKWKNKDPDFLRRKIQENKVYKGRILASNDEQTYFDLCIFTAAENNTVQSE